MANEKRLIGMVDATRTYNGIALYMAENAYLNDTALDVLKMVADWLNEAPTVDAVEVVRCKDCNNYERKFAGYGYCYHWDYESGMSPNDVEDNDFCSYGERREGE